MNLIQTISRAKTIIVEVKIVKMKTVNFNTMWNTQISLVAHLRLIWPWISYRIFLLILLLKMDLSDPCTEVRSASVQKSSIERNTVSADSVEQRRVEKRREE